MTYRRMLDLCYYKTKSLQNVHVWCRGRNTSKLFRFIIAKIYCITFSDMSLLVYYVICVICISEKLKFVKNEAMESKTERYKFTLLF